MRRSGVIFVKGKMLPRSWFCGKMAVFDEWVSKLVFLFVGDLLNVTYSFVTARNALKSQVYVYFKSSSFLFYYFYLYNHFLLLWICLDWLRRFCCWGNCIKVKLIVLGQVLCDKLFTFRLNLPFPTKTTSRWYILVNY